MRATPLAVKGDSRRCGAQAPFRERDLMSPLRILFLIDNLRPGGTQKMLLAVVRALRATRARPAVWCLGGTSQVEEAFCALGVPVLGVPRSARQILTEPFALLRHLRREGVALVQTMLFHSDVLGRLAGRLAQFLSGNAKIPIIVSSVRATNVHNRFWQFRLERCTAPLADAFTAVSRRTLDFAACREGVVRRRATVIPNGIDLSECSTEHDASAARDALGLPRDAFVVGTAGRLHEQKGHTFLLKAAQGVLSQRPESVFLIAGYGPLRRKLEAEAAELGLGANMRFLGYRTDVPRILAALDVFALPSLWEGMSNAVFEAMAAGKPVVATAVDGNVEQVVHGDTGLLVPPSDAEGLANAMLALGKDRARAREMGRRGRERVEREFPLDRMTGAVLDLYARLLENRAGIPSAAWR